MGTAYPTRDRYPFDVHLDRVRGVAKDDARAFSDGRSLEDAIAMPTVRFLSPAKAGRGMTAAARPDSVDDGAPRPNRLASGGVVIVAGPDGAGKSALCDAIVREVFTGRPVLRFHHR